jgi:hypothetical protein
MSKTKHTWTDEHNEILKNLAQRTWSNKKQLLNKIATEIPSVKPTQALYHAIKHQGLKFKFPPKKLEGQAKTTAVAMLLKGYNSKTIQKQIKLCYGIYLPVEYYNRLRFTIRRGEYNLIKDPNNPKKFILEQRKVARDELMALENISVKKADEKLKGKVVAHPKTIRVSNNDMEDLLITDRETLHTITIINMVAEALGLDFGELIKFIEEDKISRYTPQKILQEIFSESGLDSFAKSFFRTTGNETTTA